MKLFTPLKLAGITLKNRAVMAPLVPNMAGLDGTVTEEYKDFYRARADGQIGYMVLGGVYVLEEGRGFARQLGIDNDNKLPGLSVLVETLCDFSCVGVQLSYKSVDRLPEIFNIQEIRTIQKAFAEAALRALKCGFHAVELHACHDYWLNFFLSPVFNHRTDMYGGSLENRLRVLVETISEIRDCVQDDLSLGVRLSLDDFVEGGLGLVESLEIGRQLERLNVDYISASAGIGQTHYRISPPCDVARGSELVLARALQETVSIPVIGVGRLDRASIFREAIEDGYVRLVAAGRALIADPEFVTKIQEGRDEEIRPCLACNYCLSCIQNDQPIRCVVNPLVGRDREKLEPFSEFRQVMVVGGGPAGLTAAMAAAQRGAKVRLIEKQPELGGNLNVACVPPFKKPVADFLKWLIREINSTDVEIVLNREVNLKASTPLPSDLVCSDVVILAHGAQPTRPEFCLPSGDNTIMAEDLLRLSKPAPGRYLVLGGGLVGLETAEYLVEVGADVTVLEMLEEMGWGLVPIRRNLIIERLIKAGVNLITNASVDRLEGNLACVTLSNKKIQLGPFDHVVLAAGYCCEINPESILSYAPHQVVIGDARQPRSILEAIVEAWDAVREIQ